MKIIGVVGNNIDKVVIGDTINTKTKIIKEIEVLEKLLHNSQTILKEYERQNFDILVVIFSSLYEPLLSEVIDFDRTIIVVNGTDTVDLSKPKILNELDEDNFFLLEPKTFITRTGVVLTSIK